MNPASQHQDVFISFLEDTKRIKHVGGLPVFGCPKKADKFYCPKCRFSTKDKTQYQKHLAQHAQMSFSCPFCNHVSSTRGEWQRHRVKHTGTYPYKCMFCNYGAVRNDYIVKHTMRVHKIDNLDKVKKNTKSIPASPSWPSFKVHPCSVSLNVMSGVPSIDGNPKSVQNARKQSDPISPSKVQVELLAPLNEPIQHDRPLTVTYPPELSIPPGCLVELVEVKTVNGTKELELKLVSQHPAERDFSMKGLPEGVQNGTGLKPLNSNLTNQDSKVTSSNTHLVKLLSQPRPAVELLHGLSNTNMTFKYPSTDIPEIVKKEPEECEIDGDVQKVIISEVCKIHESDRKSLNLLNSAKTVKHSLHVFDQHDKRSTNESILLNVLTAKDFAKSDVGAVTPCNGVVKQEDHVTVLRPPVTVNPKKVHEEKRNHNLPQTTELPVILSVFSLSQSPDDVKASVGWEQMLESSGSNVHSLINPGAVGENAESLSDHDKDFLYSNASKIHDDFVRHQGNIPQKTSSHSTMPNDVQVRGFSQDVLLTEQCEGSKAWKKNVADTVNRQKKQQACVDSPEQQIVTKNANGQEKEAPKAPISSSLHDKACTNSDVTENIMPRLSIFCGLDNLPISGTSPTVPVNTRLKLSLKRKRSGDEREGMSEDWQAVGGDQELACNNHKLKKQKHQNMVLKEREWPKMVGKWHFFPVKDNQPISFPQPDQPVVVLNHPKPHICDADHFKMCLRPRNGKTHCGSGQGQTLLKMKLKKVDSTKYEVVGFVLREPTSEMV